VYTPVIIEAKMTFAGNAAISIFASVGVVVVLQSIYKLLNREVPKSSSSRRKRTRNGGILLEICCENLCGAISAINGGADRVELCENLAVGGTTPSFGSVKAVVEHRSKSQFKVSLE